MGSDDARPAADVLRDLAVCRAARKELERRERGLRAEADALLLEANDRLGAKSADVLVFGEKVGTLTVGVAKPSFEVVDEAAWQCHLAELYERCDPRVRADVAYDGDAVLAGAQAVSDGESYTVVDAEGEVLPGVAYVKGGARSTSLRGCGPDDVMAALRRERVGLPGALAMVGGE